MGDKSSVIHLHYHLQMEPSGVRVTFLMSPRRAMWLHALQNDILIKRGLCCDIPYNDIPPMQLCITLFFLSVASIHNDPSVSLSQTCSYISSNEVPQSHSILCNVDHKERIESCSASTLQCNKLPVPGSSC